MQGILGVHCISTDFLVRTFYSNIFVIIFLLLKKDKIYGSNMIKNGFRTKKDKKWLLIFLKIYILYKLYVSFYFVFYIYIENFLN